MTMRARPHRSLFVARAAGRARPRGHQRGAAIITALLVVALSAILVSGMLWRQQVQIRRIENQRVIAQAQWVARGALDWTRMILRSEGDTAPGITYLGGIWGVPIAKTKLSDFLGRIGAPNDTGGEDTYISGSIEDAQAKFNLRNLVASPAPGVLQLNVTQVQAFQRLLTTLGYDGAFAKRIALQVRASLLNSATRFQMPTLPGGGTAPPVTAPVTTDQQGGGFTDDPGMTGGDRGPAPLMMTGVDSLLDVDGVTPEMVARLRPFVTVLPTTTPVNMNTAPAEVIAALMPGMSVSSAQALVSRRETVFFRNVADVQLALRGAGAPPNVTPDSSLVDVNSSYFIVHGRIQHERAEVDRTSLVYRDPTTHSTRVVRIRDQL